MSESFPGVYYDGRSSRAYCVSVRIQSGILHTEGDGISRAENLSAVSISGKLGSAPRKLLFEDGASAELASTPQLDRALGQARLGWVAEWESRWIYAVAALFATLAVLIAGYVWGLPAASRYVALRIPEKLIAQIGDSALEFLDGNFFAASKLDEVRQQRILGSLRAMRAPAGGLPFHRIVFRSGGPVGANALALPNGTIVVTDQLVRLAESDEEVLAVLGHELGHLRERHTLRAILQNSVVAIVVAWYAGDVSSIAVGIPALLLQTGYSRNFEEEADAFGARFLLANGLPPEHLATMLEKLERSHGGGSPLPYLSTHPGTKERVKILRGWRQDIANHPAAP